MIRSSRRRRPPTLALLLTVATLLAACGGSGGSAADAQATPAGDSSADRAATLAKAPCSGTESSKAKHCGSDKPSPTAPVVAEPLPGEPAPTGPVAAQPIVNEPVPVTRDDSITLAWTAPQVNADGSPLGNLAGYRIRYGTQRGSYSSMVQIADPNAFGHVLRALPASTYYVTVTAYNAFNVESTTSAEVSKTIY